MVLIAGFWIATGSPDGASAPMMAATAIALFADRDDPTPALAESTLWAAVSIAVMGPYLFAVLPHASSFEVVALAQAPAFLVFGVMTAVPATADRDLAKLDLARSDVKASVAGTIMDLQPGAYVAAGHGTLALVDAGSLHLEGYFEETKLPRIHVGGPVRVRLMGESRDIGGRVESVAGAIKDRERGAFSSLIANINPSVTWVRLAQRVPVRVAPERAPDGVALIPGRTATVEVEPAGDGPASR